MSIVRGQIDITFTSIQSSCLKLMWIYFVKYRNYIIDVWMNLLFIKIPDHPVLPPTPHSDWLNDGMSGYLGTFRGALINTHKLVDKLKISTFNKFITVFCAQNQIKNQINENQIKSQRIVVSFHALSLCPGHRSFTYSTHSKCYSYFFLSSNHFHV